MVGTEDAAAQENDDTRSPGATTGRHQRVTMPSALHSVLAKARRYRAEPERVDIVADEPLVAIVHGLHADHTVSDIEQGLVCSCERFRRGEGVCAHVLAVEQRRFTSASNAAAVADFGEVIARAIDPGARAGDAVGLFERVLVPMWNLSTDDDSMAWARTLTRATGGQLMLLGVVSRARGAVGLVDAAEALEQLVASEAWDGGSVRIAVLLNPVRPELRIAVPATLLVLPLEAIGSNLEPSARYTLVERLVESVRVPLLVIPRGSLLDEPPRSVLAAVDGSPASARVLEASAVLAHTVGAHVVVLHVGTNPLRHLASEPSPASVLDGASSAGARAWAEQAAEYSRGMDVDTARHAALGHAAGAIRAVAEDIDADIIVLGTRAQAGRTPSLGRTGSAVLRATQRPMLLVRPDACIGGSEPPPAPISSDDVEAPSAADRPRSRDVHAPSSANTDRLGTVPIEHR
jgi:nucleotide-binding universal stress UspA family protein